MWIFDRLRRRIPALWAVLLLGGCVDVGAAGLAASEWRPETVDGTAVPEAADVFVRFEGEGKLVGAAGCNNFFASYTVDGDNLEVGPVGATRMMCSESLMALERRVLAVLQEARSFARQQTSLTLFDAQGNERAHLRQTDWD